MSAEKGRITFILSHTRFASNLGASVRVMKNMGFHRLTLVRPECEVGAEARTLAMKGADILDDARLVPTMEAAAKDVDILVGTSARFGRESERWTTPRVLATNILTAFPEARIGIAFGSESNGLCREEIRLCDWCLQIPTSPAYPVLNLAQAVAIVAYEVGSSLDEPSESPGTEPEPGSIEPLLQRAEHLIRELSLPDQVTTEQLMDRLRGIAVRARLESADIKMLQALLSRVKG